MTTPPRAKRRLRRFAVTTALGLGLALAPAQLAGATPGPQPDETIVGEDLVAPTPCKYRGMEYTAGAVEKFADGQLYVCQADGTWKLKPIG